jgi:hypothetical protein
MYDEPELSPEDFVRRGRAEDRSWTERAVRSIGAAIPTVAGFFWLAALLGTGPMVGHVVPGLALFVVSLISWMLLWGRTVRPA